MRLNFYDIWMEFVPRSTMTRDILELSQSKYFNNIYATERPDLICLADVVRRASNFQFNFKNQKVFVAFHFTSKFSKIQIILPSYRFYWRIILVLILILMEVCMLIKLPKIKEERCEKISDKMNYSKMVRFD